MRPGDVIVQVQGGAVKTPDDVGKAVDAAAKSGKPVALFLINRGGEVTYIGLRLN
jgi:S1-C subfamily serine protease